MATTRQEILARWSERLMGMSGQRGVVAARDRFDAAIARRWPAADVAVHDGARSRATAALAAGHLSGDRPAAYEQELARIRASRAKLWRARKGRLLADAAAMGFDEHGGRGARRGDYLSTAVLDYLLPAESAAAPYLDTGGAGLALIEISRERRYSRAYHRHYGPSRASTRYLIGKNESGSYWSHAVGRTCATVCSAVAWIWQGHEDRIAMRQGDVALVVGRGRSHNLPAGHAIVGDQVVHPQHPAIRAPGRGERLIVARRAEARVSAETRD